MTEPPDSKIRDPEEFYRSGSTPFFASQGDQRFSYALHLPAAHRTTDVRLPLLVVVHGTARTAELYRDALAGFAERHGCVVLAPLFPAGVGDPEDLHNFKFLSYRDIRFDRVACSGSASTTGGTTSTCSSAPSDAAFPGGRAAL
jgi:poly(3-hydroxybutyrate) depolymerase